MRAHQIDAVATQPHYVDHLAPVWHALPPEAQGAFYGATRPLCRHIGTLGIEPTLGRAYHSPLCLVAGAPDLESAIGSKTRAVFLEHGAGQHYQDWPTHPSYAGGDNRHAVALFLALNETTAARDHERWPDAEVAVVGSPHLDVLDRLPRAGSGKARPVVAFCWHYEEGLVPETRSAFWYWRNALLALAPHYQLLGSGHPRAWPTLSRWYASHGIEATPDMAEVIRRADVVCFDNTSAGYEAAACGIPVVALNSPQWRRDVHHGLRFWDLVPGPQCDTHDQLGPATDAALDPTGEWEQHRRHVTNLVYPPETRGRAAQLAADAISEMLVSR